MAGRGRGKVTRPRSKANPKKQSPAANGNNKKQRISESIEISSTIRESNPSRNPKDQNQDGMDEAWMRNSVEQIRDVVTNFTNFMMSNTMQTQPGYPVAFNALATPQNSSAETQTLIARMTPSCDRLTKSAPSQKMDSKGDDLYAYERFKHSLVTDGKRMMLALNLVLKPYNKMKDEVGELAFKNLKNLEDNRKSLVKIDGDGE
ncbi:diacylglycerol kinase theta isoform X2 [Sesbania bispinosa]|nr:diacylglycerol kinase theta isoform X2 [Sesbania bispinosa]